MLRRRGKKDPDKLLVEDETEEIQSIIPPASAARASEEVVPPETLLPQLMPQRKWSKPEITSDANAKDLITFPTGKRVTAFLLTLGWGLLIGAGTVVGVIALVPTAHFLILGALVVGAFGWAGKAARDIYKRSIKEKEDTEELKKKIDDAIANISVIDINSYQNLVALLEQDNAEDEHIIHRKEKLYAHLFELAQSISILLPYVKAKKSADTNDIVTRFSANLKMITELKTRVNAIRSVENQNNEPDSKFKETQPPRIGPVAPPPTLYDKLWVGVKKTTNRLFSFLGGASAGVTVGVSILTFVVGTASAVALLSNPLGWVALGILAGAVIIGGIAVGVDFYLSRSQQRKLDALAQADRTVESASNAVKVLNTNIEHIGLEHKQTIAMKDTTTKLMTALEKQQEQAAVLERKLSEGSARIEQLQTALNQEQAKLTKEQEEAATLADENRKLRQELADNLAKTSPVARFAGSQHSFHATPPASGPEPQQPTVPVKDDHLPDNLVVKNVK